MSLNQHCNWPSTKTKASHHATSTCALCQFQQNPVCILASEGIAPKAQRGLPKNDFKGGSWIKLRVAGLVYEAWKNSLKVHPSALPFAELSWRKGTCFRGYRTGSWKRSKLPRSVNVGFRGIWIEEGCGAPYPLQVEQVLPVPGSSGRVYLQPGGKAGPGLLTEYSLPSD